MGVNYKDQNTGSSWWNSKRKSRLLMTLCSPPRIRCLIRLHVFWGLRKTRHLTTPKCAYHQTADTSWFYQTFCLAMRNKTAQLHYEFRVTNECYPAHKCTYKSLMRFPGMSTSANKRIKTLARSAREKQESI